MLCCDSAIMPIFLYFQTVNAFSLYGWTVNAFFVYTYSDCGRLKKSPNVVFLVEDINLLKTKLKAN